LLLGETKGPMLLWPHLKLQCHSPKCFLFIFLHEMFPPHRLLLNGYYLKYKNSFVREAQNREIKSRS
jgi:hypothetical protein